jgi:fibrillarin-like rRNA methylase
MPSFGMWRRVDLVCADVSEESIASIFRIENPRARNQREQDFSTLQIEAIRSPETSADTIITEVDIPEDGILHSHRCENLKPYKSQTLSEINYLTGSFR